MDQRARLDTSGRSAGPKHNLTSPLGKPRPSSIIYDRQSVVSTPRHAGMPNHRASVVAGSRPNLGQDLVFTTPKFECSSNASDEANLTQLPRVTSLARPLTI
ncbi:hypothetical protein E4U21_003063 [Claviceps maximensis]|nr:hypothetical protein E4U21_003063 [Claviceps maximensis]